MSLLLFSSQSVYPAIGLNNLISASISLLSDRFRDQFPLPYIRTGTAIKFNIVTVIKFRRLRWEGHIVRMEESRSVFKILTGTLTGKRPLGSPRRIWRTVLE